MKQKLRTLDRYIRYLLSARTRYGVHSPFLFELIDKALRHDRPVAGAKDIERIRKQLLNDRNTITKTDYGTGGDQVADMVTRIPGDVNPGASDSVSAEAYAGTKYEARVCDIARTSLSSPSKARLLFRLVKYFEPRNIIELGTSFGLTASYLALAAPGARIISMEGCPETARLAKGTIASLGFPGVRLVVGEFSASLPHELDQMGSVDFLFVDGNHNEKATLAYYSMCKAKAGANSVFVFDDIHWSDGMERAWDFIQRDPDARVTVDLFHTGLVFFREESSPEHFIIRY